MHLLNTLRSRREIGVLAALVVLCIFFTVVTNTFLTVPNILNIPPSLHYRSDRDVHDHARHR